MRIDPEMDTLAIQSIHPNIELHSITEFYSHNGVLFNYLTTFGDTEIGEKAWVKLRRGMRNLSL